jgi:hypothetical protein
MRTFAEAWPDPEIVQQVAAQSPQARNEVRRRGCVPDAIPLGRRHFRRIFQDMAKSQIKAAKKQKSRRRAPVLYHGIVVRKPHVAPDTPLPVLRKAVRSAVQRYFDGSAAVE